MVVRSSSLLHCVLLALSGPALLTVSQAFSPPEARPTTKIGVATTQQISSTQLFEYELASVPRKDASGLSYAERSRPYRRDVFSYDDWVRHRSSERFSGRLAKLTKSGIVRALFDEIILTSSVATFICVFNALLVVGFDDFAGVHHDALINIGLPELKLPAMFFTLSSPALSLLLGMSIMFYSCSFLFSLVLVE